MMTNVICHYDSLPASRNQASSDHLLKNPDAGTEVAAIIGRGPIAYIHMDLQKLDRNQLKSLLLNINAEYLKIIDAPVRSYIDSPQFHNIRSKLHEVLDELDRRRQLTQLEHDTTHPQSVEHY